MDEPNPIDRLESRHQVELRPTFTGDDLIESNSSPKKLSSRPSEFIQTDRLLPNQRFHPNQQGISFSLLLILTTIACIFFAAWQWRQEVSYAFLGIITPALWRLIWVMHQRQKTGEFVGFFKQIAILCLAFLTIGGVLVIFAGCFLLAAGTVLLTSMLAATVLLGTDGRGVGFVLGIVTGFPIGTAVSVYLSVWLLRLIWKERESNDGKDSHAEHNSAKRKDHSPLAT